ncbi:MAG: diguanylate cyclase [Chloroflexi bacterium]|nr:MAG: diguanylate cyclase [Chloroflexota bacterium]
MHAGDLAWAGRRRHRPLKVGRRKLAVGVSAGIALYPEDGGDADALMRHADAAMYSIKREPARPRRR